MADTPAPPADAYSVDLTNCDKEPIHIPGSIQPHGLFLGISKGLAVAQASANSAAFTGLEPREMLGQPLSRWFADEDLALLAEAFSLPDPSACSPLELTLQMPGGPTRLPASLHRSGGLDILELEGPGNSPGAPARHGCAALMRSNFITRLQSAASVPELLSTAADIVRDMTGFERVMLYRFDQDWNGEVLVERAAPGLTPYLGLRWPASDIPSQARELYTRNWIRLIADVDYTPAPLIPTLNPLSGQPTDLSHSVLRSVSPIHLEYLRNMRVRASMSVSIVTSRLWGLIACHHHSGPLFVSVEVRQACELLGRALSLLIAEKEARQAMTAREAKDEMRQRIIAYAEEQSILARGLLDFEPNMLTLMDSPGAAVVYHGQIFTRGATPPEADIRAICGWLRQHLAQNLYLTTSLADDYPPASRMLDTACGLAVAAISRQEGDFLLWFRPEEAKTVDWAGDPRKAVSAASASGQPPQLHPRTSFEKWREVVHGRSQPWTEAERYALERIRVSATDAAIHSASRELARINTELENKNRELDSFAYVASHDLKEPLRGLKFHAQGLLNENAQALDDKGKHRAERVGALAERMGELLDSLLKYSRVGTKALDVRHADMNAVLAEATALLEEMIQLKRAQVVVPRPLPKVDCDPDKTREVFLNLLSNALKYTNQESPRIEVGFREASQAGHPMVFYVKDDGIGIAEKDRETVFAMFRRLHGRDEYGGGAGAGLAITRRIVERHGGRIWLESTPGQGSTFLFTLAAPQASGTPPASRGPASPRRG